MKWDHEENASVQRLRRRRRLIQLAAIAVAPFTAMASSRAQQTDNAGKPLKTVRVGYQKFNTVNILKGTGAFERAIGPDIAVRWYEFAAGPQLLEALATGAIDFGHAADAPSVFAQAAGKDVVYLGAEQPYPKGIAILVAPDGPIRSARDLKGRRVAIGRGWNAQYLLVRALEEDGISYDDIEPAYVANAADARAAFQSGRVDAVGLWDPFLADAELAGARVLRDGSGLSNNRTFYLTSPAFAADHADVLRLFFAQLAATDQWAHAHGQEVAELLAPQLGVDPKVLRRATDRRHYGAIPMNAGIVAEQQQLADAFVRLKLLPRAIRVAEAVSRVSVIA